MYIMNTLRSKVTRHIKNAHDYMLYAQNINSQGGLLINDSCAVFFWDGTRKPIVSSIRDCEVLIGDETICFPSIDTNPFYSVEEFELWKDALDNFIKTKNTIPLSKKEFEELEKMVNSNK